MTKLKLLGDHELDLSVNLGATQDVLASKMDAVSRITSYSHAMLNTIVNPVSKPPEPWFNDLNGNLGISRSHAQTWVTNLAPQISAAVPQSIINFSNTFTVTVDAILAILAKGEPSAVDRVKILNLIDRVIRAIEEEKSTIATIDTKLVTLGNDFQDDYTRLAQGESSAAAAVGLAAQEALAIENKIKELQAKVQAARAKVTAAGIGVGVSLFIAVAAIALAVVTGGVGFAVVGAIGVVGVGVAATYTGIFTSEISGLINEIAAEQSKLGDKQRQVAALKGVSGTVTGLVTQNKDAKTAITTVQTMWKTLAGKVDAVHKNIKDGRGSFNEVDFGTAKRSWNNLAAFAEKMQEVASDTQVQPPIQHDRVRLFYAA